MTDLVLVRHGETEWNRLGKVQGRTDIPLNDTGREQARATAERLQGQEFDAVAASPLSRAAETAQIIADGLGIGPVELVDALVERNYGEAEGMTGADIDARFGGRLEAQETREETVERAKPALIALADRHPGQRVLVVSHGGVIGSLIRDATRWVWPERGEQITNGSDHRFRVVDGELELVEFAGRPWSADLLPPEDATVPRD
ncbi:histidine phosphatase family protein [Amnibacterium kyonggiense]|uniref:Putative phosphoglycerate mutase n=1 Tax=Amnibacterium kyonggiense TaxID=595671 RepID=A0A4R7FLQ7_9MICO|nr:histidine phosphatase family protein [Amnibacterium kyonggiense]TDS77350.1 putative phosphoglycerate mutase [Amnibacterium kyonggiense]